MSSPASQSLSESWWLQSWARCISSRCRKLSLWKRSCNMKKSEFRCGSSSDRLVCRTVCVSSSFRIQKMKPLTDRRVFFSSIIRLTWLWNLTKGLWKGFLFYSRLCLVTLQPFCEPTVENGSGNWTNSHHLSCSSSKSSKIKASPVRAWCQEVCWVRVLVAGEAGLVCRG